MFFSVVIATRNRSDVFQNALQSVLVQTEPDIEVLVVNDGSDAEQQKRYDAIISADASGRVRSFRLPARHGGHGPSYVRKFGAAEAQAPYLCFLDDDDCWTDPNHLRRTKAVLAESSAPVDLCLANQTAFRQDREQPGPIWLEDLPAILTGLGNLPDPQGAYTVTVDALLRSSGFCHLNTLIVRLALYREIGGLDERLGWEEDRDLYLRLIDAAKVIKYVPMTVARHNVPEARTSVTTGYSEFERRLSQLRLLDRAMLNSHNAAIRAYGRQHKVYTLKRIAEALYAAGRNIDGQFYAREALGAGPTMKWAAYTAWRWLHSLLGRSKP